MFKIILLLLNFTAMSVSFISNPSPFNLLGKFLDTIPYLQSYESLLSPGAECNRDCKTSERSKVCHFQWTLEYYPTMSDACGDCGNGNLEDCFHPQCISANGIERTVTSINRQLPGPPIHVCENDVIIVDVKNEIEGGSTSIHWHGFPHDSHQYMDGVPFISQCPIVYGTTFRYQFKVRQAGTFFYHSHAGHQKFNGAQGAFVVRNRKDRQLFDYDLPEHAVVLSDWMNQLSEDKFPGTHTKTVYSDSLLINGKGKARDKISPLSFFNVEEGKKYNFRIIGASSNICPLTFEIESHNFTIISADAKNVRPYKADKLLITAGERFDIVINANQTVKDFFLMRISTSTPCVDDNIKREYAVLKYHRKGMITSEKKTMNFASFEEPKDDIFQCHYELNSNSPSKLPITNLQAENVDEVLLTPKPAKSFFLQFGTPPMDADDLFSGKIMNSFLVSNQPNTNNLIGSINRISFKFPNVPIISQYEEIDEKIFCNETSTENAECNAQGYCFCTHRLIVPEDAVIEFVLINSGSAMMHPFHLHGHQFAVVDLGWFNETFNEEFLRENFEKIPIKFHTPVYKDTILIPLNGFTRIRVQTRNPNLIFFHCHYDFHLSIGMAGFLQVGDLKKLPKPPKDFPICRNFLPATI